uniref:Microtubule-associated protein Jupiter n=1 Tax=Drosophila melanogaster TaxID=7227 RepID=A0A0B4KG85_DROME|nr:jupiter, isoform I [Drosophila melanogaster]AGB95857.1 jupiter, isoform I [Drosophila melanogaster]|eukprot:NP_001262475.1 jupiter, isoform I [Drosophila melanogaster]
MISNFDCTDNQASSKVLRPPGGGSSDIFGSEMPQTPRNVKNRMASNIFAAEKDNGVKNNEGNPVTGEGYKVVANEYSQRQESSNGGTPVINKNRIPPGGYSSGLW